MLNITPKDVALAERLCLEQRLENAKLLRLDESKARTPAELDLAQRVHAAADADPMRFDKMLAEPKVSALFSCGALHFKSAAQAPASTAIDGWAR